MSIYLKERSVVALWIWSNVFLAPVIFQFLVAYFAFHNPLVIVGFVLIVQSMNTTYYKTNRLLFWTTFLLNGLSTFVMEKASIFYAVIGLHNWQDHAIHRELVLSTRRSELTDILIWVFPEDAEL